MVVVQDTYTRLLTLFHQGEQLTCEQAAGQIGVTPRQVQRCIQRMKENRVPVRSISLLEYRQQQRREQPDWREPDSTKELNSQMLLWYIAEEDREVGIRVILTEEQAFALAVAAEATRAMFAPTPMGTPLREAFDSLLAELETEVASFEAEGIAEQWSFSGGSSVALSPTIFIAITRAIRTCRRLRIDYYTANSNSWSYNRPVDPYGLAVRSGAWLMIACCQEKKGMREFNLVGITTLQETEEYFLKPEDFHLHRYFGNRFSAVGGNATYHVRLLVEADRVPYFHRKMYHHTQRFEEEYNDGRVVVSYWVDGLQEIRSFVQGWGTGVTVLDPPELVELVRREIEQLAHRYTTTQG